MSQYDFDLIVIGGGPAGESAAMSAAKHEQRVAIVIPEEEIGGACTHKGTIPSKALRAAVSSQIRFNSNPMVKHIKSSEVLHYADLTENLASIINKQVKMRSKFYLRNDVTIFEGHAAFSDANTLAISHQGGPVKKVTSKKIMIATGSRPYHPDDIDFSHSRVYDSDSILSMQHNPRKIIIYGAGVIGCEYASIFAGLGIKVDLVNNRDRLLEFLDDEISDALSYHLIAQGVIIRHRESFQTFDADDKQVTMYLASGKRITADALLWCNGRTGNTDALQLDAIGLNANHRGQLEVDQQYQTAVENVYAVGDVIGWPSLASAAYNQGSTASTNAIGTDPLNFVDDVPTGIYTLPEISSVGQTERELTDAKVPYEVGRAFFKDTARGQISGQKEGMLKLLFHLDSYELLGIHCFGAEATEIIHIGQAILKQENHGNDIRYFVNTTFNYPTMAEAYRIAALNGLNRTGY
ncbi:MAG: Si-specific NAD(P)(+) transhydrogenase [Pseudomonadales bacterium]|nr:Si-specific NAD(P)(+) transhydrogenase [Pseudomonadales bacterium]